MTAITRPRLDQDTPDKPAPGRSPRGLGLFVVTLVTLTQLPVVSAHGPTATAGITRNHGIVLAVVGIALVSSFVLLKRSDLLTPTTALYGVFGGLTLTVIGIVLFEGLSPDTLYAAKSMPFPRAYYEPLAIGTGMSIMVGSVIIGYLRWPARPRYTFLGILMGIWVMYPYLISGTASDTHVLGYAIVLGTPIVVGYIIWTDAWEVLRAVMRDPIAKRFGLGTAILLAFFFLTVTGYLSFFPEEGLNHGIVVTVIPTIYQLVMWPTLEIAMPHIPFFLAVSPGQLIIVGLLSALVGLNAAIIARHWRLEQRAGMIEGTAGSAAIVGTCTCGCCGPLVAKIAVLAVGPSIAAPLYWVFVDSASPLSVLFIVGSLVLFTGSLIYSVESAAEASESPSMVQPEMQ